MQEGPYSSVDLLNSIWDFYTETGHSPATSIIEVFEIPDASRAIVMPIKLYRHSKSSGASSLCWLGRSLGKHGNCRGHSAVKWSACWEPASQIPLISEHALFDLYGETHSAWPRKRYDSWQMFNCRIIFCHNIFGQPVVTIRNTPDTTDFF